MRHKVVPALGLVPVLVLVYSVGLGCTDAGETSGLCTGLATECFYVGAMNCGSQQGCSAGDVCAGISDGCYGLTESYECIGQLGCDWEEDCSGIAESCYSMYSQYDCNDQDGCSWSTYSNSCSGYATSCSYMDNWDCNYQEGCTREGICSGLSYSCHEMVTSICTSQGGCYLDTGCAGYASYCSSMENRTDCQSQSGCSWELN